MSLGAKIPEAIREGSDVYFECAVKANPPLTEVVWLFEGRPLMNDPLSGVLLTNLSLVMQRVRREHRGYYQCVSSNEEGIAASNKVFLNVHCKFFDVWLLNLFRKLTLSFSASSPPPTVAPVCKSSQTLIYGVARTEQVIISCQVESEPVTPIKFRWFFNNSLEGFELPSHNFTVELMKTPSSGLVSEHGKTLYPTSTLLSRLSSEHILASVEPALGLGGQNKPSVARSNATYSPRNRLGYGTLYCLAENAIGQQRDPCAFSIVEAGKSHNLFLCAFFPRPSGLSLSPPEPERFGLA